GIENPEDLMDVLREHPPEMIAGQVIGRSVGLSDVGHLAALRDGRLRWKHGMRSAMGGPRMAGPSPPSRPRPPLRFAHSRVLFVPCHRRGVRGGAVWSRTGRATRRLPGSPST